MNRVDDRDQELAAFVSEHREELESHADSNGEAARIAEAVLEWARDGEQAYQGADQ